MTKISQYPEVTNPDVDDLLVGTDVENSNATKNFTVQSIIDLIGDINQGPIGPQGVAGANGIPGPVGPAGLNWQGSWVSGTSYVADDAVGYGGASYFCILATSGTTTPSVDTTHWALLASQGAIGQTGPAGPIGPQGPAGTAILPYKSYIALLSCTNSSTVTANLVFSNLGTIVWTRNSAGNYTGTLSGAFTIGKTLVFLTLNNGYRVGLTSTTNITQNTVNIEVFSTTNTSNNIDYIENIAVEIKVYE